MDVVVERVAALDVHKASVTACVRVPAGEGGREPHLAEFATTVRGLLGLRDWLAAHRVRQVVLEATGVYWRPVWHLLEGDFELMLVNARHVKQVPGRKTDLSDAAWLCQLAEAGLLRANFVPPKPIRDLRQLTRYRKTQIAERQREAQRLHKALQDSNVKLDCVASDLLGASGRAMLDALVAGTTDPEILADLAKGRLRQKIPALREALEGRFSDRHALLIGAILAHLDFLDEQIERLSDAIEERVAPYLCRDRTSSARSGLTGLVRCAAGGACARLMVRVRCARTPGLTSVRDPGWRRAGDMMFDGVIPLGGALRPLGLSGPSTKPWRQGRAGSRPRRIWVTMGLARTGKVMRAEAPPRRARAVCGSCA